MAISRTPQAASKGSHRRCTQFLQKARITLDGGLVPGSPVFDDRFGCIDISRLFKRADCQRPLKPSQLFPRGSKREHIPVSGKAGSAMARRRSSRSSATCRSRSTTLATTSRLRSQLCATSALSSTAVASSPLATCAARLLSTPASSSERCRSDNTSSSLAGSSIGN